jgi:transcription elongation factor Elf1
MIERDLNDSFPETQFTEWTCPSCGHEQQVMLTDLESVECQQCDVLSLIDIDTDWFDLIDPVERDVA